MSTTSWWRRALARLWSLLGMLRRATANLLFLALLVVVIYWIGAGSVVSVPQGAALVLQPGGTLVEQRTFVDPLAEMLMPPEERRVETTVRELVESIEAARQDERISSIVLSLDYLGAVDLTKVATVGAALDRFREAGKRIYAYGDSYSQDQYALALYADEVYLNPMGMVALEGYSHFPMFYKDLLDNLSIRFHVFRVGTFKSAVEPLMRNDMSPEAKEAATSWLTELWATYGALVHQRRNLPAAALDAYVNTQDALLEQVGGDSARLALEVRLVDGLRTRDEFEQALVEAVGEDEENRSFRQVHYLDYLATLVPRQAQDLPVVAVLTAQGMILDGDQPAGAIGGDTLSAQIREVREDESVKALVVRVDSEGGSAFASELIRRELELTQQAGIPVVVSMGSLAASGGYWLAATADEIWAAPTTLTGSIGIFGAFPTLDEALHRIGVHSDGVATSALAGSSRLDRPLSPQAERAIQRSVEHGYRQFLERVAAGRKLAVEDVDRLAQGRVWTGSQARQLGLVDGLGGLEDAIGAAARRAGLVRFHTDYRDPPESAEQRILRQLLARADLSGMRDALLPAPVSQLGRWLSGPLASLTHMNDRQGLYALCAECLAR